MIFIRCYCKISMLLQDLNFTGHGKKLQKRFLLLLWSQNWIIFLIKTHYVKFQFKNVFMQWKVRMNGQDLLPA